MAFCENCGKEMSDQAVSCPNCGHPRAGVTAAPLGAGPIMPTGQRASEWWKRLVAYIIDAIVVGIPSNILAGILGFGAQRTLVEVDPATQIPRVVNQGFFAAYVGMFFVLAILSLLYYAYFNGSEKGQTVGKMAMKIQVRDIETGGPIGFGRGAIRTLIPGVISPFTCGILGLVDGLWPLWDARRQALHDKMANSIVVDVP